MSYQNTDSSVSYVSGFVNRGAYIELDNYRIYMSASGNPAPQISTVSGTSNIWFTGRQTWYNGNYAVYVTYVSPFGTSPAYFNGSEGYGQVGDTEEIHFTDGTHLYRVLFNVADFYLGTFLSIERLV